jgi:hypothetical protein
MVENGCENVADNNEKKLNTNDLIITEQIIPSNCLPLSHQVAGHFFGKGRTKLGKKKSSLNICIYFVKLNLI